MARKRRFAPPRLRRRVAMAAVVIILALIASLAALGRELSLAAPSKSAGQQEAQQLPQLVPTTERASPTEGIHNDGVSNTCRAFTRADAAPAVDSTVLMLFDAQDPAGFEYSCCAGGDSDSSEGEEEEEEENNAERQPARCMRFFDEKYVRENFNRVAASYLSSPFVEEGSGARPYHGFFGAHAATFWEIDAHGGATPLTIDVVYTYVNPAAPSFRRHMEARGIKTYSNQRYNDWEELRYSFRSLLARILESDALRQAAGRRAEDVATLQRMGYTVSEDVAATVAAGNSLVDRVFLVLSDVDQVPAWLDVKKFPQLRVVTHAELFNREGESHILPTLNSNCIESGLYRIPTLSRFFLYVNNDHIIGRRVSFFDWFRPLSPLRQSLHMAADQITISQRGSEKRAWEGCVGGTSRRHVFMEPLLNSEHNYNPNIPNETDGAQEFREEERRCFNQHRLALHSTMQQQSTSSAATAAEAATTLWSQRGWRTRQSFAYPLPRVRFRSPYHHHVVTTHSDGMKPPWGYPHQPMILNRDQQERLLEVDAADLTDLTRRAYERRMYPFTQVDMVASYTVAQRRSTLQEKWQLVLRSAAHPLQAVLMKRVAARLQACKALPQVQPLTTLTFEDLGPLYGDSWAARLQAPDAADELAFWWMPPPLRPPRAANITVEPLEVLYDVPHIRDAADGSFVPRFDRHYFALFHDMNHHIQRRSRRVRRQQQYLFVMLKSEARAVETTKRLAALGEDSVPLWMCFNDDFPVGRMTQEEVAHVKRTFATLMATAIGHRGPAAWETDG